MNTRCKPGDLAIVIDAWHPCNLGTIVQVIRPADSSGDIIFDADAGLVWWCKSSRPMKWTCHGKTGKGDGPIAVTFKPRPRDLTDRASLAKRTDRDLYNVISRGGGAVERSPTMPGWGSVFSPQEIWDLVAYVRQFPKQP